MSQNTLRAGRVTVLDWPLSVIVLQDTSMSLPKSCYVNDEKQSEVQ